MPARAVQIAQFGVRHERADHTEPIAPDGIARHVGQTTQPETTTQECTMNARLDLFGNQVAARFSRHTADPAERFGYGPQLFLDGIRQQLALLSSAAQAADRTPARPTASRPGAPDGRSLAGRRASEK